MSRVSRALIVLFLLLYASLLNSCVVVPVAALAMTMGKQDAEKLSSAFKETAASITFNVRKLTGKTGTVECDPGKTFQLCLYTATLDPEEVDPGATVVAVMQYGVIKKDKRKIPVTEKRTLKFDNHIVTVLDSTVNKRTAGTWETKLEFRIPKGAKIGAYTLTQEIKAGGQTRKVDSPLSVSR